MTLVWIRSEQGDSTTATVNGLQLTVTRNFNKVPEGEPAYGVFVFGECLPTCYHTMDEGQAVARTVAASWLRDAYAVVTGIEFEIRTQRSFVDHTDEPRALTGSEIAKIRTSERIEGVKLHREWTHSTLAAAVKIIDKIRSS